MNSPVMRRARSTTAGVCVCQGCACVRGVPGVIRSVRVRASGVYPGSCRPSDLPMSGGLLDSSVFTTRASVQCEIDDFHTFSSDFGCPANRNPIGWFTPGVRVCVLCCAQPGRLYRSVGVLLPSNACVGPAASIWSMSFAEIDCMIGSAAFILVEEKQGDTALGSSRRGRREGRWVSSVSLYRGQGAGRREIDCMIGSAAAVFARGEAG
jgi:hypothetical protein